MSQQTSSRNFGQNQNLNQSSSLGAQPRPPSKYGNRKLGVGGPKKIMDMDSVWAAGTDDQRKYDNVKRKSAINEDAWGGDED